jgi:outer membrane protein OmpA-like peptidoglycan-associated protein
MANGYSWSELRDGGTYRLPGPEHIGWWAAVAMLVSILLHVAVFLALDRMKIALRFEQARELNTRAINVRQVEVRPFEIEEQVTPENLVVPSQDTAALLEEIDLLNALPKDTEIDIKPDIQEAEYALQMQNPALAGDPAAIAMEVSAGLEFENDLPELGREPESLKPAAIGQVTVDPGAVPMEDDDLGKFTEELIKRGAGGTVEKGALDGIATLDDLLDLPANVLLASKTMLPSDLLFEFNSTELRESAKVGLMKLALLMDRNPQLYCWVEGHTDLVGGDEFNLNLSIRRAEAVKNHLVESMRMDASKIITRGFGRFEPLVIAGDVNEQAINRRVEIRMRKTPPADGQLKITPQKAAIVEEPPAPPPAEPAPPAARPVVEEPPPPLPPRAVLVKPQRALPLEEEPAPPPPPRAAPVENPDTLRALPVEVPESPRALPVDE